MAVKPRTNLTLDAVILALFLVIFISGVLLWVVYPPGGGGASATGAGPSLPAPTTSRCWAWIGTA
ncbi:MAG: DUF4405 domain-containing protein [Anaerolineae bacterium]|nr:DUF4405 domain-containing protein [Anaerolineae bacterium]